MQIPENYIGDYKTTRFICYRDDNDETSLGFTLPLYYNVNTDQYYTPRASSNESLYYWGALPELGKQTLCFYNTMEIVGYLITVDVIQSGVNLRV